MLALSTVLSCSLVDRTTHVAAHATAADAAGETPRLVRAKDGGAELNVKVLEKERTKRVSPEELLSLCIEFQESIPRDATA